MPDKQERQKPHDPKARKAARERVKGWFDDPKHKPTKADDEATREDALDDPALQEEDE